MLVGVVALALALPVPAQAGFTPGEAKMIERINSVRQAHGLGPLRIAPALNRSAGRFSLHLMKRDAFGHRSRVSAGRRFGNLGEILSMHSGRRLRVRGTLRRWMSSSTHRAVILKRGVRWIGAGATKGRFGGGGATIWCVQVGR